MVFTKILLCKEYSLNSKYLKYKNNKRNELWKPEVGTTWNWILDKNNNDIKSDYNVDVLDIDLFDNDKSTIELLKSQGHHIICYFSAGTIEKWRPDAEKFLKVEGLVRDKMDEWNENYLDITNPQLKPIMADRFKLAKEKGCDAVEADNIDIYSHNKVKKWKKPISVEDQINYDIWLTEVAHSNGLSIGMKNDIDNIDKLHKYFDFAINEECYDYDECGYYADTFIKENKAVFTAAYGDNCDEKFIKKLENCTKGKNLSIIIKDMELDQEYIYFDPDNYIFDDICNGNNSNVSMNDNNNNNSNNNNVNTNDNNNNYSNNNNNDDNDNSNNEKNNVDEATEIGEENDNELYNSSENIDSNNDINAVDIYSYNLIKFIYYLFILFYIILL
ncbi:hypothetical protein BCR36DRAFT_284964 [Piromyces finnis]|uniref:alpha-galactosidase n=1 Tax=Piromyces finnis TaxID=1754191 RepID=A0A1Y1VDI0_9FUNG|nr:hypothetical protein BCR36DRAFT_284964 [Piromyces finnis]|eukprot:ORX53449.1 hypothetical protein BCR36DRAFT_284964 [Piromyces finnis]